MSNEKYLDKITSQHKTKPKFKDWLDNNLLLIDDITEIIENFDNDFDIYKAIGKQQDILGEIIGRHRKLDFQPADGSDPNLNDDIYRILQLAKISINQWDGTIPGIMNLWDSLFSDYQIIVQDNQDMSMNLLVIGLTSQFEKELMSKGYTAPKPEGVKLNYEFYMYHYQMQNSSYFSTLTYPYNHYTINAKATIAKDTTVENTQYINMHSVMASTIKINALSHVDDVTAEIVQKHGFITNNINHYIITE